MWILFSFLIKEHLHKFHEIFYTNMPHINFNMNF